MSERRLAETGQPLEDLTEEQRDEIKTVVREIIQRAHAYSERGRASMPIEVDSALILAGVTAALLYPPGSHHLASGIGYPHLHRTDLTGECGECAASGPIDSAATPPTGASPTTTSSAPDTTGTETAVADKNGKHPCADPSCPGVLCGPGGALDYPGEQVTESAEVRVGFRYQDGEVLTPAREALSEDDEIPTVVIDLGDGEWLTLAELRDLHSEGGDS